MAISPSAWEPEDREAWRLDGWLVIPVAALELEEREAWRLDGWLVIPVAALELEEREVLRLDGWLVIPVAALELEERTAWRLDGWLVIPVAALEKLSGAGAVRGSTREAVSLTEVARSSPSRLETDVAKAAGSALKEFARFKISHVSPFGLASKTAGRTVERKMKPMVLFIIFVIRMFLVCCYYRPRIPRRGIAEKKDC